MNKIRVAVIGAGGIGGAHLRAYATHAERCEIVGIADIDTEAARAKVAEYGGQAFTDGVAMLEQLQPEAVSICTPPKFRLPFVEAAAKQGIAVLCEKPPARTLAETEAIVDAMRGGLLQFAFCHRFHAPLAGGDQALIRQRPARGSWCKSTIASPFDLRAPATPGSRMPDIAGGGVLIDTLVHSIDIFRALTGDEIESAQAAVCRRRCPSTVEDSASLLLVRSK